MSLLPLGVNAVLTWLAVPRLQAWLQHARDLGFGRPFQCSEPSAVQRLAPGRPALLHRGVPEQHVPSAEGGLRRRQPVAPWPKEAHRTQSLWLIYMNKVTVFNKGPSRRRQ